MIKKSDLKPLHDLSIHEIPQETIELAKNILIGLDADVSEWSFFPECDDTPKAIILWNDKTGSHIRVSVIE